MKFDPKKLASAAKEAVPEKSAKWTGLKETWKILKERGFGDTEAAHWVGTQENATEEEITKMRNQFKQWRSRERKKLNLPSSH